MVPSSLNTIPEGSPEKLEVLNESPELNEAVVTVVALSSFETVKVASSLTIPVSSCATGALPLEATVKVMVPTS